MVRHLRQRRDCPAENEWLRRVFRLVGCARLFGLSTSALKWAPVNKDSEERLAELLNR